MNTNQSRERETMRAMMDLLHRIGRPRLLVLGDLVLDRFTHGDVSRVSPEAPVVVLRAERGETRPGGAAGVAVLLRALQAGVTLAGVVGDDDDGRLLRTLLRAEDVDCGPVLCDPGRPTTSKERLIAGAAHRPPQPLLRVDREDARPLDAVHEHRLLGALLEEIDGHDAVLVSDYAKGVGTPALLARVIEHARQRRVPVFVDPARIADYARYRGAALLSPNRVEAELASGKPIRTPDEARAVARELCTRFAVGAVLVKLDGEGMVLVTAGDDGRAYPTRPRPVCDVAGAGDMVLAMVALCRAAGLEWEYVVPLANIAAGLEVERPGVAPVSWAEIHAELIDCTTAGLGKRVSLDGMASLAESYRAAGESIVFTNGCFDLLHPGHVACLQEAAGLGDVLVVAVNSDRSVRRLKGPDRPVLGADDRAAMLAALECVDHVLVFDADTPHEILRRIRPDVLVKGGTCRPDDIAGREIVEGYGGSVCLTGAVAGVSTTAIVHACRGGPRAAAL